MFSILLIRLLDIIISLIIIIISLPIIIFSCVLIYIYNGPPIFYISERVGRNGKLFKMYKLRTMKNKINSNEEDKITKIGKFLRRTSLDEVPQTLNILKNEMSLVGPRPLPPYVESQIFINNRKFRRLVKPGITGYSQIKYNKRRRNWDEKSDLDIKFVKEFSIFKYIHIILLTFPTIIKRFRFNKKGRTL